MKTLICAIILSLTAVSAYAKQNSDNSQKSGVSNIENQTSIYENTTAGKAQEEWMKGKVVKPDCSPAMNRVGWAEGCK